MIEFIMPLSFTKPPLNLNQRGHWAKFHPDRKALRQEAAVRARSMKIPACEHITTRLHYQAPDNRDRDEDNIILTAKPLWDGLVDAGVVPGDTSRHMTKLMPKIHPAVKGEPGRCWLEIGVEA